MYLQEDTAKLTANIKQSAKTWAECKIDELCATKPKLSAASVYLKRGISNWLDREDASLNEMISNLALFVADKDGIINTDTLIDDAIEIFREMDVNYSKIGAFGIEYGKGSIVINIPHNVLFDLVFGDLGQIKITTDDILEIKAMLGR